MARVQRGRALLGVTLLLAVACSLMTWTSSAFAGMSSSNTSGRSDVIVARAEGSVRGVILRMKKQGLGNADIMKATGMDAKSLGKLFEEHRVQLKFLKPVVQRLASRGMSFEEIVDVTRLPEWSVKDLLKPAAKKKTSKKATKGKVAKAAATPTPAKGAPEPVAGSAVADAAKAETAMTSTKPAAAVVSE